MSDTHYRQLSDEGEEGVSHDIERRGSQGQVDPVVQSRTRRNKIALSVLGLCVVGIIVAVSVTQTTKPSSSVQQDNKATESMYDRVVDDVKAGHTTLDETQLGSEILALLKDNINATNVTLTNAKVALVKNAHGHRTELVVTGDTVVFGVPASAVLTIYHVDGVVHCLMTLTPHYNKSNAVDAVKVQDDSIVTIESLLPNTKFPNSCSDVKVQDVQFIVSSHDVSSTIKKGLNVKANLDTSLNAGSSILVKAYKVLLNQLKMREGYTFDTMLQVVGTLKPVVKLNITSKPGQNFHLGPHVTVENVTAFVCPKTKNANISATMLVDPPNVDQLVLDLVGSIDLDTRVASVYGGQVGSWDIPGRFIKGLTLSQAVVAGDIRLNATDPAVAGYVQADIAFGKGSCFLEMGLPPANNMKSGRVFGIEAVCQKGPDLASFPGAGSTFPPVLTGKAAMVFSPVAGTYDFSKIKESPVPSLVVVPGLNFVVDATITTKSQTGIHVDLSGQIQNGSFELKGDVQNVVFHKSSHDTVTLKDLKATLSSSASAGKHATFTSELDVTAKAISPTMLQFDANGQFGKGQLDLEGSLDQSTPWTFPVGSKNWTVSAADIKFDKDSNKTSFAVTGTLNTEMDTWNLVAEFPDPAHPKCGLISVDEVKSTTVRAILDHFIPSHQKKFDAPDDILDVFMNTSLSNIDLTLAPGCGNFSLTGKVTTDAFGSADVGLKVFRANGSYHFGFYLKPLPGWSIASSHLISDFPDLDLHGTTFLFASHTTDFTIPITYGDNQVNVTYATGKGLTLRARLIVGDSHGLEILKRIDPKATVLDCVGIFNKTGVSVQVQLDAQSKVNLGHGATLTKAAIDISDFNHQDDLTLSATVTVPNPTDSHNLIDFDVSGEVKHDDIKFHGDAHDEDSTVAIPIGHTGVSLTKLSLDMDVVLGTNSTLAASTASLDGEFQAGKKNKAVIDIDLALLKGDVLDFTGKMVESPPLTFGDLMEDLAGSHVWDHMSLPSFISDKVKNDWTFKELDLNFSTSPSNVVAGGRMGLFGFMDLSVFLHAGKFMDDGSSEKAWAFSFGAELGDSAKLSSVVPGVTVADHLPMVNLVAAVASAPDTMDFIGQNTSYPVETGLNFLASLSFSGTKGLEAIHKWTGADDLMIRGVIKSKDSFTLHADVDGNMRLFKVIDITAAGVVLSVTPAEVSIGVESDMNIKLSHRPQDTLYFHGDVMVGDVGLRVDVAMTKDWVNPFGLNGVTIDHSAFTLEVSWELVPTAFGLEGGLHIGDVGGHAAVYLDENAQVLFGELENINLNQIISSLLHDVGVHRVPHIVNVIDDISFKDAKLEVNDADSAVTFNGVVYPPGVKFDIDQLDMWEIIKGSADLAIGKTGFLLNATLDPINLLHGNVVISGAHSKTEKAKLFFQLDKDAGSSMPKVNISGGIDIFNNYLDVAVTLDDSDFMLFIDMSLLGHLFRFTLDCQSTGPARAPTDFSVSAKVNNEFQDYIATEVPKLVEKSKQEVDSKLNGDRDHLKSVQDDAGSLEHELAHLKAQDNRAMTAAEKKLDDARNSVSRAKAKVDGLQHKIDDIKDKMHHLKWYDKYKDVGYGIELAGLYTAKGTADLALDAANAALKLAEKAVSTVPDVDPRVVALETAIGAKHAALEVAQKAVEASEKVYNALANLVVDIAKLQDKAFNIEEFDISGSLSKIKMGDLAHLRIKGKFAGRSVDFTVDVNLANIDSFVHACWHKLVHIFTGN